MRCLDLGKDIGRRKGRITFFIIIPLIIYLSSNNQKGDEMRKGGKVAVVHILFSSFFIASLFYLSSPLSFRRSYQKRR